MVRRAALAVLVLALTAPVASAAGRQYKIVNGEPTTTADLPFMAGLQIALQGVGNSNPDALCGGSLIAARWVLTAAHCLAEEPVDVANSFAVIGATNLNAATPDQKYRFAEIHFPPEYKMGNGGSDMGLVRLERPAAAQQLRLLRPSDGALFTAGMPAVTAGWGYTEDQADGGTLSTNQLRKVGLAIVSDQDCQAAFTEAGQPDLLDFRTELCAIAPNKDSCNGDSGGPLIVTAAGGLPALAGAVSFGIGSGDFLAGNRSCNEGPPGVYSKVGVDPLNAFARARVPQVEIDPGNVTPVPGQRVTFTATASAPGAAGPFGGYDALAWDLNGDGAFDEAAGQTSVAARMPDGGGAVAVRATTAAGDAEVRTIHLATVAKSAVSLARKSLRVRSGRSVRVRVNRIGNGAGTVVLRAGRKVTPRQATLSFDGTEASRSVRLRTRGAARTVQLRLESFAGDVIAGARTRSKLKIRPQR